MASGFKVKRTVLEETRRFGELGPVVWEAQPHTPIDYNLYNTCEQPKSNPKEKNSAQSSKRKVARKYERLRVKEGGSCIDSDISNGKEPLPISVFNTVDNEKLPSFKYVTRVIYPNWCRRIPPEGCQCYDGCTESNCACTVKNGGTIPFNSKGAILKVKPLVHECGPSCKCPPTCPNRVSQHGIKYPLQIFKTELRGWGVRSLTPIPSGSFICEYIGELIDDKEAEERVDSDEYLFDIGNNYHNNNDTGVDTGSLDEVHFTIDALEFGNIGRFINHSCSPNLYAQNVAYDIDDERIPHVMMFATESIPAMQELTYDYNYAIDQVLDRFGNIKRKSCYCGSSECTGRMY